MASAEKSPSQDRHIVSRISKACQNCRDRRRRCDGSKPICNRCRQLGNACVYSSEDGRQKKYTSSYVRALEDRVEDLQHKVQGLRNELDRMKDAVPENQASPSTNERQDISSLITQDKLQSGTISSRVSLQRVPGTGELVFYGPTSNKDLFLLLPNCSADQFSCTNDVRTVSYYPVDLKLLETFEDSAQKCLEERRPSYMRNQDWKELAKENISSQNSVLLFRFATVAAGGAYMTTERAESGKVWEGRQLEIACSAYEQCQMLCGPELGQCNTVLVEAFALLAHYAVLMQNLIVATTYLSIACTMAKRLALHVECSSDATLCQLTETEIERRHALWWLCRFLDLRLAILNGQATFLFAVDISTFQPLKRMTERSGDIRLLDMSLELIQACHIEFAVLQDEILSKIFSFDASLDQGDYVYDAHQKYMAWFAALPYCIRNAVAGQTRFPELLFFHMDFNCGLILLHRSSRSTETRRIDYANKQCSKAASTIASLLNSYLKHYAEPPADFMVVHALCTAAIVHLIGIRRPEIEIYRSSLSAFKNIVRALTTWSSAMALARDGVRNLRDLALSWEVSPVNSQAFWDSYL